MIPYKEFQNILREKIQKELIENLKTLPDYSKKLFAKVYSHENQDKSLEDIVKGLSDKDLQYAYELVYRTITNKR